MPAGSGAIGLRPLGGLAPTLPFAEALLIAVGFGTTLILQQVSGMVGGGAVNPPVPRVAI